MPYRILLRRDLSQNWNYNDPVLMSGEPGYEMDTRKFKMGDGQTPWSQLPYYLGATGPVGVAGPTGPSGSAGPTGPSGDATLTSVTYDELVDLIDTSALTPGSSYLITDFRTCYDQPDFNSFRNGIIGDNYKESAIEPIVVFATSTDTISSTAYQPNYPKDRIQYDWTFNQTERTNGVAYGRITERIDEFNNRTDYDHRTILFKRYSYIEIDVDNPLPGTVTVTPTSSTEMDVIGVNTNFESLTVGQYIGFSNDNFRAYEITGIDSNTEMYITGLTNTNLGAENNIYPVVTEGNGKIYYQNNISTDYTEHYTFDYENININNYIGDFANLYNYEEPDFILANNVFQGFSNNYINNTFGDACYNNSFRANCGDNTIGNYFYNNTTDNNFNANLIGNSFFGNRITAAFERNRIGENFYNNYIVQNEFYRNNIMNSFNSNIISGNDFQNNEIGNQFQGNLLRNGQFYKNDIGNDYNNNKIYSDFYGNLIGNGYNINDVYCPFGDNIIGEYFQNNNLGDVNNPGSVSFYSNKIGVTFQNNTMESNTDNNVIGNNFEENTISGLFQHNQIFNGFKGNLVNNGVSFESNQTGFLFLGNEFNGNCSNNIFGVVILGNDFLGTVESNNIGGGFFTNTIGGGFFNNKTGSASQNNVIGENFRNNEIGNLFQDNQIGDEFGGDSGSYLGNKIGNNFDGNIISGYFYNNTIPDNFTSNTIGDYFQWNIINTVIASTDFTADYGNITDFTYSAGATGLPDALYSLLSTTTNGNGVNATFDVVVSGGVVSDVNIDNSGKLYNIGNTLTISGTDIGGVSGAISGFVSDGIGKTGSNGIYNAIIAGGTGSGENASFNITVTSDLVSNIEINDAGVGYKVDDLLVISGDSFGGTNGSDDITIEVTSVYSDDITITVTDVSPNPSVYEPYTCQIFEKKLVGEGTNKRLSFYDENDILTITNITE